MHLDMLLAKKQNFKESYIVKWNCRINNKQNLYVNLRSEKQQNPLLNQKYFANFPSKLIYCLWAYLT